MKTLFRDMEIWRRIVLPSIGKRIAEYQVSNFGNVRVIFKRGEIKERKQVPNEKGYLYVVLSLGNGKAKGFSVHRLVAFAFPEICGEWFEGGTVNHKNEDKTDNRAENLEWLPLAENIRYGTGIERSRPKTAKAKEKGIICYRYPSMEFHKKYGSETEASEDTGISLSTISMILNGRQYRHQSRGLTFRRA